MSHSPHWRRPAPSLLIALSAAILLLMLAGAGGARAAIPYTKLVAGPVPTTADIADSCTPDTTIAGGTAGTASDFCIAYAVDSPPPDGDDLQHEVVDTPISFAARPAGLPTCTDAQFGVGTTTATACPAATQIGDASADATLSVNGGGFDISGLPGFVYNLNTTGAEVARFGLVLNVPAGTPIKLILRATLRPAPTYGLETVIDDLPRTTTLGGQTRNLATTAVSLRLWGAKADHPTLAHDFAVLGSDCSTDQSARASNTTYADPGTTSTFTSAPYKLTGCAALPFTPSVNVTTGTAAPDRTTDATVKVGFAQAATGPAASTVKSTTVTLPAGLSLSAQIASGSAGLPECSAASFAVTSAAAASCPAGSAIGTVRIDSPLIDDPLTGTAFLGAQAAVGALPDLYIQAALGDAPNAPRIKLVGHLSVDDQNRVVTTLADLPQLSFSTFTLAFRGGDNSVLTTPPTCGTTQATISATPHAAPSAAKTASSDYVVDQACGSVGGFAPQVAFASPNPVAGQHGTFITAISRRDGDQRLTRTAVDLPAGEVATLTGVPECSKDQAAAGACPETTRIGSITTHAGVGPAPYRVDGGLYLVTRDAGSVVGASIQVPVKLGDVDLGTLVVPAHIDIRGNDLGLRFIADVPERFKGLPLNIRDILVSLDRPNFALNPTNCGMLYTQSSFTGSGGATATTSATYQVSGCDKLPFNPTVDAAVTGQTKAGQHPDVAVRITAPAGTSAMRQAYVTLPAGLAVDLSQIPRACDQDVFLAGGCPASSVIGTVSGALSITTEPLGGNLYLLKAPPGKTLPGLGLEFTGRFAGRVVGSNAVNAKTGQLVSAFDKIPDLPLTALQINIKGGTGGILTAAGTLCTAPALDFGARLIGQATSTPAGRSSQTLCGVPLSTRLATFSARLGGMKGGRPTLVLTATALNANKIARVDVTMPAGFSIDKARAKSRSGVALKSLTTKGSTRTVRVSSRKLRATMPKGGTGKVRLLTRTGTMRISSSKLRKTKSKQGVVVTVTLTDGTTSTVPLVLSPH